MRDAQLSLDDRGAGRIDFALTASAEDSEPVGFEIEGAYSFESGRELAVLDLTYRQLLGEESQETRIISTGKTAWAVFEGDSNQLTAAQAKALRLGNGGSTRAAVPALDLSAWLIGGDVKRSGETSTVTGEVRASAFVADLQEVAAQVAGASTAEPDAEAAERIDEAVKDSEMTIEVESGSLRVVNAVVRFGATVPAALREALGSYAGATLELSMVVDDIKTPLRVDTPA